MALDTTLRIRLTVYALVIALVVAAAFAARPPTQVTMEVGPIGGSYHQIALQYQKFLAPRGITLKLRSKDNSLEIIDDVISPTSDVDIGFEAQDDSSYRNSPVFTAGHVQLQPLFIFASANLGRRIRITDLRGRRIVMPPTNSATTDAALRVFRLFDITPDNSSFAFLPLAEAAKRLKDGDFDAGVFMLAPDNPIVRDLVSYTALRLVPLRTVKAITNQLQFLQGVVLPQGIYDIADGIPPADVPMLAGMVDVVFREGLHPYIVYSLLEAMAEVHRGSTFLSNAGEYPSIRGATLKVPLIVQEYYRAGLPWTYRNLPPWLASFVNRYLVLALGLFVVMELFRFVSHIAWVSTVLHTWRTRLWLGKRHRTSVQDSKPIARV